MKAKLISFVIALITVMPIVTSAQTQPTNSEASSNPANEPDSAMPGGGPPNVLGTPAAASNPEDALQDYESIMVAITQRLAATLTDVTEAVQRGELSNAQGKTITAEQYLLAKMQFNLVSAWRQMQEQDLAKDPAPAAQDDSAGDSEIVLAQLPFSSFELSPSLASYLTLTESQVEAIKLLMTRERRKFKPLLEQLRVTRENLNEVQANDKQIKALADREATMVSKLIVANAHMQLEIYKLLTPQQRSKLDEFKKRSSEPGTIASR